MMKGFSEGNQLEIDSGEILCADTIEELSAIIRGETDLGCFMADG